MRPERMRFGIFMAPFHRVGENPTVAMRRNMELIEWMDGLDYDEAWIGEHHSAGWEIIADPAVFIAAVAERTRHIKLGSGVVSLPYHHPLMVADRFVQLDHMTRGRTMMGVGPGALTSDAFMMGIDPVTQRPRMEEALGVIMRLLHGETVDHKSDWFELRSARLQLLPYTRPCFPMAVASQISPAGMVTAGRNGVGVLSLGAGMPGGKEALPKHWAIAEEEAAKAGKTVRREEWRLMLPIHIAESREQAIRDIEEGQREWSVDYFERTLGRPHSEVPLDQVAAADGMILGSPEDAIATIERLQEVSGGFGGILGLAHEWTTREKTLKSYELFSRYVMPHFQGTAAAPYASQEWTRASRAQIGARYPAAIYGAFKDAGREIPEELIKQPPTRTG
jgi:limonene 1,2-monooxygenase